MKIPALYVEGEEEKWTITSSILTRDSLFVWFDSLHDSHLSSQIGMGLPSMNQAVDTLARNRLNEKQNKTKTSVVSGSPHFTNFSSLIPVEYIKKRFLYTYLFVCN